MQKSIVAGALCAWVKAVEQYHNLLQVVRPKLVKKVASEARLQDLMAQLQSMKTGTNRTNADIRNIDEEEKQPMPQTNVP